MLKFNLENLIDQVVNVMLSDAFRSTRSPEMVDWRVLHSFEILYCYQDVSLFQPQAWTGPFVFVTTMVIFGLVAFLGEGRRIRHARVER